MTQIYALCEPDTGQIRYIGKANDAARRFKGHLRERRRQTPVYRWIGALRARGLVPKLSVIETCPPDEWRNRERVLIAAHPGLLNLAEGGDEPFCPSEVRASNGRATAAKIHGDPMRKQVWALKRRIGSALRDGYVSERAKAKLREAAAKCPQLFAEYAAL